jgi:hypothetical protein
MQAPQNRRFYFEVHSSSPLAHLDYMWTENICQNIWDKSEVLLETLWRTCHELGNSLLWITPTPQNLKENKIKALWVHGEHEISISKIVRHHFLAWANTPIINLGYLLGTYSADVCFPSFFSLLKPTLVRRVSRKSVLTTKYIPTNRSFRICCETLGSSCPPLPYIFERAWEKSRACATALPSGLSACVPVLACSSLPPWYIWARKREKQSVGARSSIWLVCLCACAGLLWCVFLCAVALDFEKG